MPGLVAFLRCVGRAALRNGPRALAGLVPCGETAFEIARDAYDAYRKDHGDAQLPTDVHEPVQTSPKQIGQTPEQVGAPLEDRLALVSFLEMAPAASASPPPAAAKEDAPPIVILSSRKRTYTLHGRFAVGEVADVHLASTSGEVACVLKMSREPEGQVPLENERRVLTHLLRTAEGTTYSRYLPSLVESFAVQGPLPKRVNVFLHEPGFWTLEQVHEQHPALDGRHLAWIFNRLLTVLGFCHSQGMLHGAVLPCHVLIHAGNHGLRLVGWGQSVAVGRVVKAVSPHYRLWFPPEVQRKQPATAAADLFLAARCMIYLAGGDPVCGRMPDVIPILMRRFIETCLLEGASMRPGDAWTLMEELDGLLRSLYGPPMFHDLIMT